MPEGKEPPERYVLRSTTEVAKPASAPARIRVVEPRMAAGLDSDRIAVLRANRRLDHYADARWAAPLPRLLQAFLADSLDRRYGAVALGSAPARFRLVTVVRDFQAEYPDGSEELPRVRVRLSAVLWDQQQSEAVRRERVALTARAKANRLGAVVAALEGAMQTAADRIMTGLARHLTAN